MHKKPKCTGILHAIPYFDLCFNHKEDDGSLSPCFAALQRVDTVFDSVDLDTQKFTAHCIYHYKCLTCGSEFVYDESEAKRYKPEVDEIGIYSLGFEPMTFKDLSDMDIQVEKDTTTPN